ELARNRKVASRTARVRAKAREELAVCMTAPCLLLLAVTGRFGIEPDRSFVRRAGLNPDWKKIPVNIVLEFYFLFSWADSFPAAP
ncbi:hypothetical protein, partial [Azotobacter armeniacus]